MGCRLSAVLVLQLFSCLVGSLAVVSQLVCLPIPVQSLTKKPTSGVCICLLPAKVIPLFVRHYSDYLRHDVCVCSCNCVLCLCAPVHMCVHTFMCVCPCTHACKPMLVCVFCVSLCVVLFLTLQARSAVGREGPLRSCPTT